MQVVSLAQRPDLADAMWAAGDRIWPDFMQQDPVGNRYYGRLVDDFGAWSLLAVDDGVLVARAFFVPFAWDGGVLPDRGWDAIIEQGVADHDAGRAPNAVSALEIGVVPERRGEGLSSRMLEHMRRAVAALDMTDLFAPVRPSGKSAHPLESMDEYLRRRTDEELPADSWLRVHVRAGARVLGVAPESMRIEAGLEDWRRWTGLPFERDGDVIVPHALVPVHVDLATQRATYVEPNVWVHHDVARRRGG